MKISFNAFKKEFDAWLARRDNPNKVTLDQVNVNSKAEVDAKMGGLMLNQQFPIDRIGDTSFFPISIDGSYDATSRRNQANRGNSVVEVDGSISFIGSYTNGLSFGLYMFRLVINGAGELTDVEPKSGRYQTAKMKELGFFPTMMTYNDASQILVVRDDRTYQPDAANELGTRVRIVKTNGTMNSDNHSCSWLGEQWFNNNVGFIIIGSLGYVFELKTYDMTIALWTFDPSKIGVDETIIPVLIGKDISTKGFYGNEFVKTNHIKWANKFLTTSTDVKADYAMARAITIDSGVNDILSNMLIITKHPTKNTVRILINHRLYINKVGWTSYYFPNYTIDLDLSTMTAEVDPVTYNDNPSINTNITNTSAATRTGVLMQDIFSQPGVHASNGCGYHPNGTLYRIQCNNEGEFIYYSRYQADATKYSLFEIYGKIRYNSLASGSKSTSRSLARRKPFIVGDNFRNFYQLDRDVYRFITKTTSSELGAYETWVAVKLNNDNFEYIYTEQDQAGRKVIGVEPQTKRRVVTNGDGTFINVLTFGKDNFYSNHAWVFCSTGAEAAWATRKSNLSYIDDGIASTNIWAAMASNGTAKVLRAEITAHVRNLIAQGVILDTIGSTTYEPEWSLTIAGDPTLPAILHIFFKGASAIGTRDYVMQTKYTSTTDTNGVITFGDLEHEALIWSGYSATTSVGNTSMLPTVTNTTHTNLFVYVPEADAWYIKYTGVFIRSSNGGTLTLDITFKNGKVVSKTADINYPWMQGQTHAFYHPSVGILKNAASEAPTYGNSIGLYNKLDINAAGNLITSPETTGQRWALIMQQTLDSWKIILPDEIPVTFNGRQYDIQAGKEFDLLKLYPTTHANNSFLIYVEEINGSSVEVNITDNTDLKETSSIIIIGGATTDASKVSTTFSDKVTRFGGLALSRTRRRNSILVTNGAFFGQADIDGWKI